MEALVTTKTDDAGPIGRLRAKIRDVNGRIRRLIERKERLMRRMIETCPHALLVESADIRTMSGVDPAPRRCCIDCGEMDRARNGRFRRLPKSAGRSVERVDAEAFTSRLGDTLRRTGINL